MMASRTRWLALAFGFLFAFVQEPLDSPVQGTVTDHSGQPLAGVTVYGGKGQHCCPLSEQTTTDPEGTFRLIHPRRVLHFGRRDLESQVFVVQPGSADVHITMLPVKRGLTIPACRMPKAGEKFVGPETIGLNFKVNLRSASILGRTQDVDYVRYVIKPKQDDALLEVWIGPFPTDVEPDDELFSNSISFKQKTVFGEDGPVGEDSRGHLRSGGDWRWIGVAGVGGAFYRNAQVRDARIFDEILDSVCQFREERVPNH